MAGDRRTRGRGVGLPESSTPGTPVVAPEDEALVVLAVRGPMEASALASALALDGRATRSLVACQAARGLLEEDAGGRARLTGAGLAAAGAVLAREQHALGPATAGLAERFDDLNRRVKAAITDWQVVRVGSALVPNDHSDPRRDAAVIERLMQAGSAAAQLLRPLSRARRRIEVLLRRLDEALSRVVAGGSDWICGLGVDSVHSVWWSLHAELLALLGRERGEADA